MTPPLPPELLSEIVILATVNPEPAERQKTRNAFRLVCRAWHGAFDYWRVIDVGEAVFACELGLLAGTDAPVPWAEIRCAVFSLGGPDCPEGAGAGMMAMCAVLERTCGLKELTIVAGESVFFDWEDDGNDARARWTDHANSRLTACFARLKDMRAFTAVGVKLLEDQASISLELLKLWVAEWPVLQSLALTDLWIIPNGMHNKIDDVLSPCANLRTLRLRTFPSAAALASVLDSVPPSVTSLEIDDYDVYREPDWRDVLLAYLDRAPASLECLVLADSHYPRHSPARPTTRVAAYGAALGRLTSLRKLTINPCATADLRAALGRLPHLTAVTFIGGEIDSQPCLAAEEVGALLSVSASLGVVRVAERIWSRWSAEERAGLGSSLKPAQKVVLLDEDGLVVNSSA